MSHDGKRDVVRLAYLVSHPIQYQVPFLRRLAQEPDIDVTAIFRSDFSVRGSVDPGFGVFVKWDIDLLAGYTSKFLKVLGKQEPPSVWRPMNLGLSRELRTGRYHAILLHGYTAPYQLYAIVLARLLGVRVLVRSDVHAASRRRTATGDIVSTLMFALLRRLVDRFMAVGSANRHYYRRRGIPDKQIGWMPYTVDNARFSPPGEQDRHAAKAAVLGRLGVAGDRRVILFASKLLARKRCADLLRAFARLDRDGLGPRPFLIVAGDGQEAAALRELATTLDLAGNVAFIGFQNQAQLPELYWASDIFVLPSDNEPWGLVVNEALSAGCAVVVAEDVGAVADLVRPGVNGFTFPAGDVAALTDRLNRLLAGPDALMAAGAASRQIMASWDVEAEIAGLKQSLGLAGPIAATPGATYSPATGHHLPAAPSLP
jgi:glycosyltransferase involved in cell wall biosynthesis